MNERFFTRRRALAVGGAAAVTGAAAFALGTLYYFAPGSQGAHRFVRVRASATTDPEDVPLAEVPAVEPGFLRSRPQIRSATFASRFLNKYL